MSDVSLIEGSPGYVEKPLIENHLHYRRDVALEEDACQVRKGVPHALVVLNSFVLVLFDCCGVINVKQQMRLLEAQPLLAAQLLLGYGNDSSKIGPFGDHPNSGAVKPVIPYSEANCP